MAIKYTVEQFNQKVAALSEKMGIDLVPEIMIVNVDGTNADPKVIVEVSEDIKSILEKSGVSLTVAIKILKK